jgi:hypothetical protein
VFEVVTITPEKKLRGLRMSKILKAAIGTAAMGKNFPINRQTRSDPEFAAMISKLHVATKTNTGFDNRGMKHIEAPAYNELRGISDGISRNLADNQTVLQTLPDNEAAIQILVSSVISPKDLMSGKLTIAAPEGSLPPDIASALVARTSLHFERDYKIAPLLPRMLRDILADTGSYAVAVIPENSIDDAINNRTQITMESLTHAFNRDGTLRSMKILGPAVRRKPQATRDFPGLSMESFNKVDELSKEEMMVSLEADFKNPVETFISVTDNPDILKIPAINQKMRESNILDRVGPRAMEAVSLEAVGDKQYKLNDREMTSAVFKDNKFAYTPVSIMKTNEQLARRTIGNPLIMHLPSESVIPVYIPGRVEVQIGFFVILDGDGHPLTSKSDADHYQQLQSRMTSGGNFASAMLQKVSSNMNGFSCNSRASLDYSTRVFGQMIEQDILARLRNGQFPNGVAIAKAEEVYRTMFARALAKQHTQLLFLPIELATYFAFQYNADGIGRSRLDNMKILNSLRSMLLFSNVMAAVKNSIGRTEVKIKLDESDPDPQKAIERIRHDLTRARMLQFPVGTNSPMDIVDFIQTANMEFTYEGHPGLPDVSIDISEKSSQNAKPDTDLEDSLRKQSIMGWGISPSTVDATFEADFATSVVTNNLLLAKQVMQIQDQFHPLLEDHMHKVALSSAKLITDLRKVVEDNFDKISRRLNRSKELEAAVPLTEPTLVKALGAPEKENDAINPVVKEMMIRTILEEFLKNFTVSLPRPNSATLENQMIALDTYTKALDIGLDAYINSEFLTADTVGDIEAQVGAIKAILKSHFVRKWMAENGCMPELADLTTQDEEGKPIIDVYTMATSHLESITKSMTYFFDGIQLTKRAANVVVQNIQDSDNTQASGSAPSGDAAPADDGFGGGSDDMFSMGPMPGDDTPLDEAPPDEADPDKPDEKETTETTETPPSGDDAMPVG